MSFGQYKREISRAFLSDTSYLYSRLPYFRFISVSRTLCTSVCLAFCGFLCQSVCGCSASFCQQGVLSKLTKPRQYELLGPLANVADLTRSNRAELEACSRPHLEELHFPSRYTVSAVRAARRAVSTRRDQSLRTITLWR